MVSIDQTLLQVTSTHGRNVTETSWDETSTAETSGNNHSNYHESLFIAKRLHDQPSGHAAKQK